MKEDNTDKNIWADKLSNLPVPVADPMWDEMKAKLDKEMPVKKKDNRWLFGLLLLLLLIGICTYPPQWKKDEAIDKAVTTADHKNSSTPKNNGSRKIEKPSNTPEQVDVGKPAISRHAPGQKEDEVNAPEETKSGKQDPVSELIPLRQQPTAHTPVVGPQRKVTTVTRRNKTTGRNGHVQRYPVSKHIKSRTTGSDGGSRDERNPAPTTQPLTERNIPGRNPDKDTGNREVPPVLPAGKDSLVTKGTPDTVGHVKQNVLETDSVKSKKDTAGAIEKKIGFAYAVGLNQFFALGEQEKSKFNSKGESGTWSDYLPVPQIRVHSGDRLYAQLEAQFNTPQYTKQVVADREVTDTNQLGQRQQHTVFIRKLFYFNVPLSVHFRVADHFYVGAGVQYARLTNAVAFREERRLTGNRPDSIASGKIITLKGDSVYQRLRTNEFRFLVDANYHWKRLHAGVRYNQAFTPFINYRISNTQVTQARNNSLQLYVRYTLFKR